MENQLLDSDLLDKNNEGKSLQDLLSNGYETHAVDYIKKGFEIFKQNIAGFIGFLIVIGVIQAILGSIPIVKGLAFALIAPIMAGYYIVAKMIDKKEPHSFSNFFDGTKNYVSLLIVSVIPTLVVALIMLVVGGWTYFKISFLGFKPEINFNNLNDLSSIASATGLGARVGLAGLIAAVVSILFMFATFFVLFEKFEPVNALDISRKLISKKFVNWLGFLGLIMVFNFAGALCLGIGLFVTIPSSICALYVAYEEVVGMNLRD